MAVLLRTDGPLQILRPENGRAFTLAELQALVGGYIEVVRARGRRRMLVVNEEGRYLRLALNRRATALHQQAGGAGVLVGSVILASWTEMGREP